MKASMHLALPELLAHEPYLRRLLRSLLADENAVDDVLQDTWTRALAHPARAATAGRTWLGRVATNLARDARRSQQRRRHREERVAAERRTELLRAETDRSESRERVVEVVLELEEPYRGAVLGMYFEQLTTAELAAREGVAEGTVRSWLTRARGQLRQRLDAEFGGERSGWAALAVPLGRFGWAAKAAAGLVFAGGGFWAVTGVLKMTSAPETLSAPTLSTSGVGRSPLSELAAPAGSESTDDAAMARTPALAAVDGQTAEAHKASERLFAARDRAVQVMRELERRYRTPAPELQAEYASWIAAAPETRGLAVLADVDGSTLQSTVVGRVISRGELGYFSFHTGEASYGAEPDIGIQNGVIGAGFYGRSRGAVWDLGDLDPFSLNPAIPPAGSEEWAEVWDQLTASVPAEGPERDAYLARFRELGMDRGAAARTGAGYLVRQVSPGEHEILVAMRVVSTEFPGCTFAYDILRDEELVDPMRPASRFVQAYSEVPEGPAELRELTIEELVVELERLRADEGAELIAISESDRAAADAMFAEVRLGTPPESGLFRMAERGTWTPLSDLREGPCYYAFRTGELGFGNDSLIGFESDRLTVGSSRDNWCTNIGALNAEQRAAAFGGRRPDGLTELRRETWDFVHTIETRVVDRRAVISAEDEARGRELGLSSRVPAREGCTYLLRSAAEAKVDLLVVLTVVARDSRGVLIAWRTLDVFRE